MTFDQYLVAADLRSIWNRNERRGQAYFNALSEANPPLAYAIVGTPLDPFHDDAILPAFLLEVAARWQ